MYYYKMFKLRDEFYFDGDVIKKRRYELGLSLNDLAFAIHDRYNLRLCSQSISSHEKCRTIPNADALACYSNILQLDFKSFYKLKT